MTQSERLTLDQLAAAVHMTARNVRAYQTRGLLQAPRREGRASVYGPEHVRRLQQVLRARSRGASLRLLRTLLEEGRDLDGVWVEEPPPADGATAGGQPAQAPQPVEPVEPVVDVTDLALAALHTADCLARRRLPLAPLLAGWGADADGAALPGQLPGAFACAVTSLAGSGTLGPPEAVRLAAALADAAAAVAAAVVATGALLAVDPGRRDAAAARIGELAGALVEQLVTASAVTPPR